MTTNTAPSWHAIGATTDLWDGVGMSISIHNQAIGVYRHNGQLYAMEDICPHAYALLSGGFIENGCVECPVHQALFEITSGKLVSGPGQRDLKQFPVRDNGGVLEIQV